MWLIRLALHHPRMVWVMVILILLLGVLSITQMQKDIFPSINLTVICVIWNYGGLPPQQMERYIVRPSEAAVADALSGIDHIQSQSLPGLGVIQVYFQPGTKTSDAMAQVTATMQTILLNLPPGTTPPYILQYNASNVPIVQLVMSSATRPLNQVTDLASNTVNPQLITIPGASISAGQGGHTRSIVVDLDPQAITAEGVTAQNVTAAIGAENVILPAGNAKMGSRDYMVSMTTARPP